MADLQTDQNETVPDVLRNLNSRQAKFSQYMAQYDNPLKCARLAGYAVDNVSNAVAYQLAGRADIQAAIAYYRTFYEDASLSSPDKVIRDLSILAHTPIARMFDSQWNPLPKDEIPDELLSAITGVEVKETKGQRRVTLKFAREFALGELGKIFRLYGGDESKHQGFSLTINLGQQVNVSAQAPDEPDTTIGHLGLSLDQETS